ncbi:hypothetical protein DOTSEDRAFT_39026 [Dothistroma septosporum NZE10]|uniref:Zinc finger PHD-type domain-containing protein n=1 Tax=Dothistroma septosporum (strain NZE10 / CBS 128990) TaxID=675120 RepID=M2YIU4_DOTSN|nr:hypothetical protein DOTSEDRAFT_39026 [Dothistroma septosporum NZE10]
MTYFSQEDLVGPVDEAADLQSLLGVLTTRGETPAAPPLQPQLWFGMVKSREEGVKGVAVATSTNSASTHTEQELNQAADTIATTPLGSSAGSSQVEVAVSTTSPSNLTTTSSSSTSTRSTPKESKSKASKCKSTTSSTSPQSATKRKSRSFEDDDDEYRAPSTPRTKTRRSGIAKDDDEEYGPLRFASRTMTRQVRRISRSSDPYIATNEEGPEHDTCLTTCDRPHNDNMLDCAGVCDAEFHAPCVGFRLLLPKGRRWLCFECRKARELGMRTNGIVALNADDELVEIAEGSKMEEEWRRDGWMA